MATERFPSNDELAYEARRKEGFAGDNREGLFDQPVETESPYALDGNKVDAYLGVDPSYVTYANKVDQPLRAKSGVEKEVEDEVYSTPTQFGALYSPGMDDPRKLALDAKEKAAAEAEAEKAEESTDTSAAPVPDNAKSSTASTPPAPSK